MAKAAKLTLAITSQLIRLMRTFASLPFADSVTAPLPTIVEFPHHDAPRLQRSLGVFPQPPSPFGSYFEGQRGWVAANEDRGRPGEGLNQAARPFNPLRPHGTLVSTLALGGSVWSLFPPVPRN
jgi:hypothetical protein